MLNLDRALHDGGRWAPGWSTGSAGCCAWAPARGPAERVTRFGFRAPGRAEVACEDGRPFHDLDHSHGRWSVALACRDELYRGGFEIEGRDRWTAVWQVLGPRKDQVLRARYDRAG